MRTFAEDAVVPETPTASSSTAASDTHERKRKQLFDCLNSAEKDLKGTILEQTAASHTEFRPLRPDDAQVAIRERRFRGEESIFKKPLNGIMKCLPPRKTPDYQVNPHKWKKYSLSDADTSDRTNTAAAFEFLKQIEARKRDETSGDNDDNTMDDDSQDGKIVFKQRRTTVAKFNQSAHLKTLVESGDVEENAERPVLKGSKVVMPEYVVGQKVAKEKRPKTSGSTSKRAQNELKLGHLFEEEADED